MTYYLSHDSRSTQCVVCPVMIVKNSIITNKIMTEINVSAIQNYLFDHFAKYVDRIFEIRH